MDNADLDFARFIKSIKELTGIDLTLYKEAQMKRRLTTLRMKLGYASFDAYFAAIAKDKDLLYEFLDRMTINVSEFWRNPNRWVVLKDRFFKELAGGGKKLKVWSAACSTGEEPYTLAMIMNELGLLAGNTILATDLDEGVIAKAKQGIYMDRSIRDVPADFMKRYFRQEAGLYHIVPELFGHVSYKKQDLLADKFDTGFDLIVCRNVMIYFTEEAKDKLYQKFSDALRPGGLLFVGSTEQIFTPSRYKFELADTFFYRKLP
ncbi:protein-glutamate O-methyltransferase CheR [Gorillibacterium sp. CAU 1737]|uniref:CheR family methyltransferase n=1 Tax=Gorillibacterium sp. CAU 1737 TaxID=3140362 RepID=UPI00326009CF